MTAYYNEFDPYAAQWLRNLIAAGHIAPGFVDERSIEDVKPWELFGYTQCHFFAGAGVWSLALRRAGWPDDRHVWTASCPCQPFSSAGQGAGFNDERHLWPAFYHLVGQLEPTVLLGEQVASKDADAWIDLVHADMEVMGYAFGCVPFPSASVGAPHIRDRAYWVAYANIDQHQRALGGGTNQTSRGTPRDRTDVTVAGEFGGASGNVLDGLAHSLRSGQPGSRELGQSGNSAPSENREVGRVVNDGRCLRLAGTEDNRHERGGELGESTGRDGAALGGGELLEGQPAAGPVNGLWRDADWLHCRDGKWRPVEPGTFPLVNGAAARVGRLRAYGNALNAEAARIFIESVNEVIYETN